MASISERRESPLVVARYARGAEADVVLLRVLALEAQPRLLLDTCGLAGGETRPRRRAVPSFVEERRRAPS